MATLPVSVNINGQIYEGTVDVPTVRIPELSPNILPFDPADKLALYDSSENKTVNVPVDDFRNYMIGVDSNLGQPPVLNGTLIEIPITAAMSGNRQVIVPALAGKPYLLTRRGVGPLGTNEYLVLPSGGFEILEPAPAPSEGETFFAQLYELSLPTDTGVYGGFITGIVNVTDSLALSTIQYNKLLHVIGNAKRATITLPDVAEASPKNLIIPIETNISNQFQTRIVSTNGQLIYYGDTSQTDIYLGISEHIWLFAGVDGWYVIKASEGILNVGQPLFDYTQRLNTSVATGQIANRVDLPRLMKFLQENPSLWVEETQWQTTQPIYPGAAEVYYPYKGFFSRGDGSTTIRFPDLQDLAFAGLKYIGFGDTDRYSNNPGGVQPDMLRSHDHDIQYGNQGSDGTPNMQGIRINPTDNSEGNGTGTNTTAVQAWGQSKTRMANVGLLPLIRI